jgi:hypothetical protein
VSGILAYNLGTPYAVVALATISSYTVFTVVVSNWRTEIRKKMNKEETEAGGKVVDSLINYEVRVRARVRVGVMVRVRVGFRLKVGVRVGVWVRVRKRLRRVAK